MWIWEKLKLRRVCKEKLYNSFPFALKQDVEKVIEILRFDKDYLVSPDSHTILFENVLLNIPCRIYFDEPNPLKEQGLTNLQKSILNCIFLRHKDGFIRQRRLQMLIDKTDPFIIPFMFQLLGEYVIEILFVLDKHINEHNLDTYSQVINENQKYWQQTESRMISYWNEYYRRSKYRNLKDYIGKQLIDRLKKANAQQSIEAIGTSE